MGPWDEQLKHVGHDHEFHVRALCRGLRVRKLPSVDYFGREPRAISLSSLESFKTRHRDGGMISAYRAILAVMMGSGAATPYRRRVMATEVIRLAATCRNFDGSPAVSEQGVLDASRLLLRCWWRIGGRLPAMALLFRLARQVAPAA